MMSTLSQSSRLAHIMNPRQRRTLEQFGRRVNKMGANFAICSRNEDILLLCGQAGFKSSRQRLFEITRQVLQQDVSVWEDAEDPVQRFDGSNRMLAGRIRLPGIGSDQQNDVAVALIDLGDVAIRSAAHAWETKGAHHRIQGHHLYLAEMLAALIECFDAVVQAEQHTIMVGTELAQVYEELVLLHKLNTNMKVTESDGNFLQMACDSLTDVVRVEGIAILLERESQGENKLVLAAGSGLIDLDEHTSALLWGRLADQLNAGKDALLDSEVFGAFEYDWPSGIRTILAVPLLGKDRMDTHLHKGMDQGHYIKGLMVAVNAVDKPDFDSTDIKLFNSVANGCAVFIENGRLFSDLNDLYLGSLRALTNSIDAKDCYTHGHSERVAFIARWIAEQLVPQGLMPSEHIQVVYLTGLLHDIGKIGVDDHLLRKTGSLTDEERDAIRKHPQIGAGILRGIKQMRDVIPGVMCHHERHDGQGYPNQLKGDQIPLVARIVGLADSFDAMTSRRSYRDALTIKQAMKEIEANLGRQFDPVIGRVFLDSDINRLWNMMQSGGADMRVGYGDHEAPGTTMGLLVG